MVEWIYNNLYYVYSYIKIDTQESIQALTHIW